MAALRPNADAYRGDPPAATPMNPYAAPRERSATHSRSLRALLTELALRWRATRFGRYPSTRTVTRRGQTFRRSRMRYQ